LASTKTNVFASFAGQIWTAILGVVFVPIYLRYIGVESYGLIGIYVSLQTFLSLLDFGISPTLSREMARLSVSKESGQEMHDLRRTLAVPNWLSSLAILIIMSGLSPIVAKYWVQPKDLDVATITQSFLLISASTAIQFLSGFNAGGLIGLQKQVLLNSVNIVSGTLRSVGAWLVLAFVSPTIQAFLWWQLIVVVLQAIATRIALSQSLYPAEQKGRFQKEMLRRVWRFAAGMTITGVLALILTQTDKVILSRMLDLEKFGYYSIAITISSMAIGTIVASINNVVYPKLASLVALGDDNALKSYYHRGCQLMSAFLIPTVVIFAFFSYQILLIWSRKPEIAEQAHILLTLVVIGAGLNGLMMIPYHLQLAHNWTRLGIYLLISSILTITPLMVVGIYLYGAVGGVLGWVLYNALYGGIMIALMHRRILIGEQWKWLLSDVLPPAIVSIGINALFYLIMQDFVNSLTIINQALVIAFISVSTFVLSGLSLSSIRNIGMTRIFGHGQ
jgi:O-antigen/teichoic acid export membrane protein